MEFLKWCNSRGYPTSKNNLIKLHPDFSSELIDSMWTTIVNEYGKYRLNTNHAIIPDSFGQHLKKE